MSKLGSWDHAARIATGELARRGWPRLASLVGGHVASFGDVCWQTDASLAAATTIRRPDGRPYHPESIARSRRQLRDAGLITSQRVFVGGKLPSAKWRSARGTTLKTFLWKAVEQKNPFNRRERRQRRQEQARETREKGDAMPPRPRFVDSRSIADPVHFPAVLNSDDGGILEAVNRARAASERRAELEQQRASQLIGRPRPPERPPPE